MSVREIVYAEPEGQRLIADGYFPASGGPWPVVIAVHGGSWRAGTRKAYQYLGPWLAERGYALLALDYRLIAGGKNRHPAGLDDVWSAVTYVRENAGQLDLDAARICLLGDSAGGHLVALAGLTKRPQVQAVVPVVGVHDLALQWQYDLGVRPVPAENIAQNYLGVPLYEDRRAYFDASPISHAIAANCGPAFLVTWSMFDDIVPPAQGENMLLALKQAGFWARPVIQQAPHFWIGDPIDEPGSHAAYFAHRLHRFLQDRMPS